jgi:hypothetical protein
MGLSLKPAFDAGKSSRTLFETWRSSVLIFLKSKPYGASQEARVKHHKRGLQPSCVSFLKKRHLCFSLKELK